jgi:hypothetical protein
MLYEIYTRIAVGAVLEPDATHELVRGFHVSLGLEPDATLVEVHERLLEQALKHKRNVDPRVRYELEFERYVDERWDIDCAIGGVTDGGVDGTRGYVFVGIRIDGWEDVMHDHSPHLSGRPKTLAKGDLSAGSDFLKHIGPDHKKEIDHAARMRRRARKEIDLDAMKRVRALPTREREVYWALIRWLVPKPA